MWTKGRAASSVHRALGSDKAEIYVEFKKPIFLPAKIELHSSANKDGNIDFEVAATKNDDVHLKGYIKAL
jgi:hypothetical protein